MGHINIRMETDMKETGTMISRMELEPIITLMGISIRENGSMGNLMEKETTYTMETKEFTRATGKMERRKDLVS